MDRAAHPEDNTPLPCCCRLKREDIAAVEMGLHEQSLWDMGAGRGAGVQARLLRRPYSTMLRTCVVNVQRFDVLGFFHVGDLHPFTGVGHVPNSHSIRSVTVGVCHLGTRDRVVLAQISAWRQHLHGLRFDVAAFYPLCHFRPHTHPLQPPTRCPTALRLHKPSHSLLLVCLHGDWSRYQ